MTAINHSPMEEMFRESKDLFRKIFEDGHIGMVIEDRNFFFLRANAAFCSMIGYSEQELVSRTFTDITHPDHVAGDAKNALKLASGDIPVYKTEKRYIRKDGSVLWGAATISAIRNDSGEFLSFLCLIEDISMRKLMESALENSIRFNNEIISGAGEGIIVYDRKFHYLVWNPFMEKLTGLKKEDVLGKFAFDIFPHLKEQGIDKLMERALAGEIVVSNDMQYRVPQRGISGWTIGTYAPHKDLNGTIIGVIGMISDITKRKKTESLLMNAQKLESLGVLAGGIAHDFNNLLGGIFGYIDLAAKSTKERTTSDYLGKAQSAIDRARGLTRQLLTFAKGGVPIKKLDTLAPLLRECVQFALSGSRVSCDFRIPENLWLCEFDKNQIEQVIDNLVINAQQAMPEGGTIEISAENITLGEKAHLKPPAGNYVKLSIKDHGIGMPKEILEKIFDPFFTTKSKGHGLGLSTCYSVVNRHGGCIEVESEPGKGSTFTVHLPASPGMTLTDDTSAAATHRGTGTILVMDDEEVLREAITGMLGYFGYSVVCARNGREAVDLFSAETRANRKIAAMILDLTVPGGPGGKEAAAEVRKIDRTIPIFVASGYANDPVMADPGKYGFTASIPKPFSILELSDLLNRHLHG
jgi:PAS domain S-box-containing protein